MIFKDIQSLEVILLFTLKEISMLMVTLLLVALLRMKMLLTLTHLELVHLEVVLRYLPEQLQLL